MSRVDFRTPDGVALNVEVDGSGPALLLVNGAFCTVHQWDRVVDELAASFRVVRHDVRGTGASKGGEAERDRFEQYADDLVAICDELGIASGVLWGMAWGARVALVAAARQPERFERVVLSDLAIDPADVEAQKAGAKAAQEARARAGIAEVAKPEGFNRHDDFDRARRTMAATIRVPDLMPFVTQVKQPVLIATGEHDPNLVSSRRALAGFSDARLEVLAHTGHGSVLQSPALVVAAVLPFLPGEEMKRGRRNR